MKQVLNKVFSEESLCYYYYNDIGSFCGTKELKKKVYKVNNNKITIDNKKIDIKKIKNRISYYVYRVPYTKVTVFYYPSTRKYRTMPDNIVSSASLYDNLKLINVKIY